MPRITRGEGGAMRRRLTAFLAAAAALAAPAAAHAAPPAVPTGLTATAGDGRVTLDWNDSTDLVPGDRYQVYVDRAMVADGPTESRYTVTGLQNGRTYSFRVSAGGSTSRPSTERRYGDWTAPVEATPRAGLGSFTPFPGSPFRTRIPSNPTVHSKSSYWVDRLVADGKPENLYLNDWHYPQYEASASDPEYTVTTTRYVGPQGNGRVRLPAGARPAAGGDANLGITERSANRYWGFYGVESIDHAKRTIRARGSGTTPLDGNGVFYGESSMKMATKMGVVTPEELDAGRIDHALMVVAYCTTGATNGSGTTRQCSSVGKPEGPPNGARLQLQISDTELAAFPAWKRTILRAMRDYGIYIAETGGGFLKADYAANSALATKWQNWMSRNDDQPGVNAAYRTLDLVSGVNWRSRLRVIAP
jgi:hypothetical protein